MKAIVAVAGKDRVGIIADEAAIGMVNSRTTAVRIIPAPLRSLKN